MRKYMFFFLICFINVNLVYANEVFQLDEFVYFDPITNQECGLNNYWTIYNKDTTCYRFIVLDDSDTSEKKELKIMLDHDVYYGPYDNYQNVLNDISLKWVRYNGIIDIIDEDTIYRLLKLNTKPTIDNSHVFTYMGYPYFSINSQYVLNKKEYIYYGFWSKTLYEEDSNYVYTVSRIGANALTLRNQNRGIRPVITVNKSFLSKMKKVVDISTNINNDKLYKYGSINDKYKYLQGFTLVNNKLIFYSSDGTSDYGYLSAYDGENYNNLHRNNYYKTGHGNDVAYNLKTNKVLIPSSFETAIYQFNGDTLEYEKTYNATDLKNTKYWNLAYDYINNKYLALNSTISRKIYILDDQFTKLYSFELPIMSSAVQGMDYHNGYLYVGSSVAPTSCPSKYHLYCFYKSWSGMIYVYNVKFNNDGTPHNDFGKLVDRFYINDGLGEMEDITFNNDTVYLGFAAYMYDLNYSNKFYNFSSDILSYDIKYNTSYLNNNIVKTVIITSDEELKPVSGWNLSDDLHALSKQFVENTPALNIKICDFYNNCSSVLIDEIILNNKNVTIKENEIFIKNIDAEKTVAEYIEALDYTGITKIMTHNGVIKNQNEILKTGDFLELIDDYGNKNIFSLSIWGDVDSNGKVDNYDVNLLYEYLKGREKLDNINIESGDVINGINKKISITDIIKLYQFTKGK